MKMVKSKEKQDIKFCSFIMGCKYVIRNHKTWSILDVNEQTSSRQCLAEQGPFGSDCIKQDRIYFDYCPLDPEFYSSQDKHTCMENRES